MFHGGPGPFGGHGDFDSDEVLGKVYDSRVIGRLPKYLAPVKGWISIGAAGMLLRTLAALAAPYLVGVATDRIIAADFSGLGITVILFVVMALLTWGGQYFENVYLAKAGNKVIYHLRTDMFDHLQRLSLSFFDTHKVGKLMSRVQNDVSQIEELVTEGILMMITSLLTLVGIAAIMITMNPRLALITLAVIPFMILMTVIWQKYARKAFIQVRRAIAVVNSQLQEDMSGVRVIQSLSREEENMEQFDQVNRAHYEANVTAVKTGGVNYADGNDFYGNIFCYCHHRRRFTGAGRRDDRWRADELPTLRPAVLRPRAGAFDAIYRTAAGDGFRSAYF